MSRAVRVRFASNIDGDRHMFLDPAEGWWDWRVEVRTTPEGPFRDAVLVKDQFIGWAGSPLPGQGCWYVDWGQVPHIVLDDGSTAEVEAGTIRTASGDATCGTCGGRRVAVDGGGNVLGTDHTRMTWRWAYERRVRWLCSACERVEDRPSTTTSSDASAERHGLEKEEARHRPVLARPPSEWTDMTHEQKLQWAEGFVGQVQSTNSVQPDDSGHARNDGRT